MRSAATAEWLCTRCGTVNRKLVQGGERQAVDRCLTCHSRHVLKPSDRPVRWTARLA